MRNAPTEGHRQPCSRADLQEPHQTPHQGLAFVSQVVPNSQPGFEPHIYLHKALLCSISLQFTLVGEFTNFYTYIFHMVLTSALCQRREAEHPQSLRFASAAAPPFLQLPTGTQEHQSDS